MPPNVADLAQLPYLSSEQQSLLLAALKSNKRAKSSLAQPQTTKPRNPPSKPSLRSHSSDSLPDDSPANDASTESRREPITFGDSFFPDFLEANTTFGDVDFPTTDDDLLNDYPSFATDGGLNGDSGDSGEKRKSPEDEEDEDEAENGKRREGEDKVAKKPGRKLITTEPTTKRKAQNRAAQRAFRERKEKHLKDLELKVSELEKVSENTNQENSVLRAEMLRMQNELSEYKKRLSVGGNGLRTSPTSLNAYSSLYSSSARHNGHLSDFQFDFSKFGEAPSNKAAIGHSLDSHTLGSALGGNSRNASPSAQVTTSAAVSGSSAQAAQESNVRPFEPGILAGLGTLDYSNTFENPQDLGTSTTDTVSSRQNSQSNQSRSTSSANSPGSTTGLNSNSSCGTSPEPQSNVNNDNGKALADLNVGASSLYPDQFQGMGPGTTLFDWSNMDFLSQQNGGQFNPQLFGDYRESQAAVVGDGDFTSGFFEDSYSFGDFGVSTAGFNFNMGNTSNDNNSDVKTIQPAALMQPLTAKKPAADLMERVARCRNGETGLEPRMSNGEIMTTHKLWHELQSCPKFLSGDLDIDTLCSELSAKATCSETGMAVPKDVVEKVLWRLAGAPEGADKMAAELTRAAQWNALQQAGASS